MNTINRTSEGFRDTEGSSLMLYKLLFFDNTENNNSVWEYICETKTLKPHWEILQEKLIENILPTQYVTVSTNA